MYSITSHNPSEKHGNMSAYRHSSTLEVALALFSEISESYKKDEFNRESD